MTPRSLNRLLRRLLGHRRPPPRRVIASSGQPIVYATEAEARALMFPEGSRFEAVTDEHLALWLERLQSHHPEPVDSSHIRFWEVHADERMLGYFATDAALGKMELFDFAAAFDGLGTLRQVEILNYRETQGQEVHEEKAWRQQFVGKTAEAAFRVDHDIRNITGATLSCEHLCEQLRTLTRLATLGSSERLMI